MMSELRKMMSETLLIKLDLRRGSKDDISFEELVNTEEHDIFQENETEQNETENQMLVENSDYGNGTDYRNETEENETEDQTLVENNDYENEVDVDSDDIDFMDKTNERPNLSKTLKAKKNSSRNFATFERNESTFFVCHCGFNSTNKSGASRHKCRNKPELECACNDCDKVCRNPGSLQRHKNSMHIRKDIDETNTSAPSSGFPCHICKQVLKSERTLKNHMKTHPDTDNSVL